MPTMQEQPPTPVPVMMLEDEIDLREYIAVLIKYWKWIVGISLLAAIAAFIISTFLPPTYQAAADVIILQSKTEISFEPKFQTVVGESPQKSFQDTLVDLASSSEVAAAVLNKAGDLLNPEQRNVLNLLRKVQTDNTGNVISIQITDGDPNVAAQLANLWAAEYTSYVNRLFSGNSSELLAEVQNQADSVSQEYRTAQTAWEQFLNDNQIAVLEREIEIKQNRLEALKKSELSILNRELDVLKAQAETLRNQDATAERIPIYLYSLQQQNTRDLLENKYQELKQLEKWLEDAQTMRNQIQKGNTSAAAGAGDALALILLRSKVLASSTNLPVQLQLNLADLTGDAVSLADVDSLIAVIQTRKTRIEQDIADLSTQLLGTEVDVSLKPRSETMVERLETMDNEILLRTGEERWYPRTDALSQLIDTLDAEIRQLQAQKEAQEAKKRELKQTRDLAWENFTTVQRKLAEVQLAAQITDSQVQVASRAITPERPVSPKRLLNTAIAGALGLMLSVFGVFAVEYWKSEPASA